MERLSYLLDTNAVSDYLKQHPPVVSRTQQAQANGERLYLAQPVHYEVMRGLLKVGAKRKIAAFEDIFAPQLDWVRVADEDWQKASRLWAETNQKGKQLSDVDYLLAALAIRLDAIIVTADNDFDALPIKHENWRV